MKLIADSGSTKTDWRIIDDLGNITQARTGGINPYYQSEDEIFQELDQALKPQVPEGIKEVFFYGAGCNNESTSRIIEGALKSVFGEITVSANSDLLAVARGLCGKNPGIACILGTGSNSCYYDGEQIVHHIPPWGTWLGDEGSGSNLGRQLIILYLNYELPEHLQAAFDRRYPDLRDTVLENVYQKPYPNRYLAQFSRFLFHHIKDPFVYTLVFDGFSEFLKRKVLKYPNAQQTQMQVSGSVGFYFNSILRKAATALGLQVKNITENPIAGLALYHQ
ncbi:MAG: ATPase [Cyclobacteriaceae bacterium]|nr:MAG: ATPase [Cyclobacteriaceae bacterium]